MSDTYDFLAYYWPSESELSADRILEHREALAALVAHVAPEVDTGPNTPFGDLYISPAAAGQAAREIAVNRLLSDLNPANAETGTVFNCEFTERFFSNFGIYDQSAPVAAGILRLRFSSSARRVIDRSTVFLLSNNEFKPYLPEAGPAVLLAPGVAQDPTDTNVMRYSMFDTGSWVVDMLVTGKVGAVVEEGAAASVDRVIPGLTGFSSLTTFDTGLGSPLIQEMARRIRTNFHPRTPVTRGGATNMVTQMFPSITLVGCTVSGDAEMRRDVANPAGVTSGKLDLMVRSKNLAEDTATVRLLHVAGGTRLRGWLYLPETPVLILSVGTETQAFEHTIYSVSEDPLKPGLSAAYGTSERLFIDMVRPMTGEGAPAVPQTIEGDETVTYMDVAYLFDPALAAVSRYAASDECRTPGVDVYVRWFVPALVSEMTVRYNRKAGVQMNLETARAEILDGYNSHTLTTPAGPHITGDSLTYAGAHSIQEISVAATLRFSVASKVWLGAAPATPTTNWATFEADCSTIPIPDVTSVYEPQFTVLDDGSPTLYCAAGERNVSWLLPSAALRLIELRTV